MKESRLLLLQILCILVLILGYLLSDAPDSESLMHFDLSASNTISAVHSGGFESQTLSGVSSGERSSGKMQLSRHFSFNCALVDAPSLTLHFYPLLPQNTFFYFPADYFYRFSKEINPPPPKSC